MLQSGKRHLLLGGNGMTMGERIRSARLEAGLSQRQLAGDEMTRNMLSALENDSAKPSLSTLKYLSEKLCKPVSFFLGEDAAFGAEGMKRARGEFLAGNWKECIRLLQEIKEPVFETERKLLSDIAFLSLAEEQIELGNLPYAKTLLDRICLEGIYSELYRQKYWLLKARSCQEGTDRAYAVTQTGTVDEILLLRAELALTDGKTERAKELLAAVEDKKTPKWNLQMGKSCFAAGAYEHAAECFHRVEDIPGYEVDRELEICCRELGDFKGAYYYATKKR